MLSKKYAQPLFMTLMSFGMSVILSGVVTAINVEMTDGFYDKWLNSWMFSFPVALIAAFALSPVMKLFVNKITSKN